MDHVLANYLAASQTTFLVGPFIKERWYIQVYTDNIPQLGRTVSLKM